MKILYFGTVCNLKEYDQLLNGCKNKPSIAPVLFESALLDGFFYNGADIEIHSFPMIPTFPNSHLLSFGKNIESLPSGYTCRWLHTINVPVIKQISRRLDARKMLKRWLKQYAKNGMIVTYSIPPFLVKDILTYAKRYRVKTVAIVPDLLRDMYINEKSDSILTKLKKQYLMPALRLQGEYDGYIYLTEAMHEVVAPHKPYMVMEGIADISAVRTPTAEEKADVRAIMYAGMLHERYGIIQLLDAFEALGEKDTELWLFGSGTAVSEIQNRAAKNPNIRYFGTVSHDEILLRERQATLLVNPRDAEEAFTQYSFPSKTIEYMLSGTPLVTTRLKGIPGDYFDFVFSVPSNRMEDLAESLKKALSQSSEELLCFGERAQQFIVQKKNSRCQSERILTFLQEVAYDTKA